MVAKLCIWVAMLALLITFLMFLSSFYLKLNEPLILHKHEIQRFVVDSGRTKAKRQQLPNLEQLDWPELEYLPAPLGAPGTKQILWEPQYSRKQMRTQWKLFSAFVNFMEELDVLWRKMAELTPEIIIKQGGLRDKIYAKLIEPHITSQDVEGSRKLCGWCDWGWPFIDIGYYTTNATHMEERAIYFGVHETCAKSDVFPLIFRPFYKHWVPTPRNSFAAIMQPNIGVVDCLVSGWDHVFEKQRQRQFISCEKLAHRYAFVEHNPLYDNSDQGSVSDLVCVRERLILGNRSIHEIHLVAPRNVAHVETYGMRVVTP
ncbi:unnamed protein product [Dibothriocephalus latus]|uniref:Uncharacterized protein n=1 Tax=Dibothriocephalus latus TaxID=60516 RepID=A0A3P7N536_DIBLA|nr:unnamed protein product [Dibothriocephalus latus]